MFSFSSCFNSVLSFGYKNMLPIFIELILLPFYYILLFSSQKVKESSSAVKIKLKTCSTLMMSQDRCSIIHKTKLHNNLFTMNARERWYTYYSTCKYVLSSWIACYWEKYPWLSWWKPSRNHISIFNHGCYIFRVSLSSCSASGGYSFRSISISNIWTSASSRLCCCFLSRFRWRILCNWFFC